MSQAGNVYLVKQQCWECEIPMVGVPMGDMWIPLCPDCKALYEGMSIPDLETRKLAWRIFATERN